MIRKDGGKGFNQSSTSRAVKSSGRNMEYNIIKAEARKFSTVKPASGLHKIFAQ
jgi:hypothetical protein